MAQANLTNPTTLNPLGPRTASRPPGYGAVCIEARRTVRHSAGFRCAMMAFIHDSFMTSHASPGPAPVDVLGMDNGLVQPSFRAQCTGPPHPVRHSSEFGMLFTVLYSPSFATRS